MNPQKKCYNTSIFLGEDPSRPSRRQRNPREDRRAASPDFLSPRMPTRNPTSRVSRHHRTNEYTVELPESTNPTVNRGSLLFLDVNQSGVLSSRIGNFFKAQRSFFQEPRVMRSVVITPSSNEASSFKALNSFSMTSSFYKNKCASCRHKNLIQHTCS